MNVEVITVTSKGQIAIPISIRKKLSIDSGDKLIAYTYGDALMLKVLKLPNNQELKNAMDEAQEWAKSVGYTESDVDLIIKSVRNAK